MENNGSFMERYLTPIAFVIGCGLIALAIAYGRGAVPAAPAGGGTADISQVTVDGEPFVGDANAPVTMAFFYDFQCPFCKQFDQTVTPELYEAYVKTGKLKIVFKDFQFLGPDSGTAALWGRAMWDLYPAQYYAWYQAMAEAQDDENAGFGDEASVKALTATIPGVDADAVAAAIEKNQAAYQAKIDASRSEGSSLGVNGTPSVVIGTKLLSALTPQDFYQQISAEIDAN